MEKLNSIPNVGKWSTMASLINENTSKIENKLTELSYASYEVGKFKGYFQSVGALQGEYPTPEVGDWAFVKDVIYGYSVDTDGNPYWKELNAVSSVFGLELSDYIKNESLRSYLLPFDGIVNLRETDILDVAPPSDLVDIYYNESTEEFIAHDRANNSLHRSFNNFADYQDTNKLFVDTDGAIYKFVGYSLDKVIKGEEKFTISPKANKAIKELYLEGVEENGYDIGDLFVHVILKNLNEIVTISGVTYNYKCQVTIQCNDVAITQSMDRSVDLHEPNALMELKDVKDYGITGYIVIDWSAVDSAQWYAKNTDGPAYLTEKVLIKELSPTIYSYMKNINSSGDPMHEAYVAAGAVWDDTAKTWSANGRTGLSNADIRSLYNNSDMDELLFRKLWNKACLYSGDNNGYMGRYNPNTGFYELNGVWDLTYEEALASYALSTETNYASFGIGEMIERARLRTTIPSKGYGLFFGITQNYTIADLSTTYHTLTYHNKVAEGFGNNLDISYAMGLRVIRDVINCIYSSTKHSAPRIQNTPLKHIKLDSIYANYVNMYNECPYLSYFTFEYAITNVARTGITLYVDADTYAYILGTKDPTLLSKDAVKITDRTGYLIPYDKNSKVMHHNTFWREELDTKGINGEYIYPSFAEYLTANPDKFATAEDWQALATLAEEKGVTITTA